MLDTLAYNEAPSISRQFQGKSLSTAIFDRCDGDRNLFTIWAMKGRNVVVSSHVAHRIDGAVVFSTFLTEKDEPIGLVVAFNDKHPIIPSRRERKYYVGIIRAFAKNIPRVHRRIQWLIRWYAKRSAENRRVINRTLFSRFSILNLSEINFSLEANSNVSALYSVSIIERNKSNWKTWNHFTNSWNYFIQRSPSG